MEKLRNRDSKLGLVWGLEGDKNSLTSVSETTDIPWEIFLHAYKVHAKQN